MRQRSPSPRLWATAAVLGLLASGCPASKPPEPQHKPETTDKPSGGPGGKELKTVALPKSMVIGNNVTLSGFYEDEALPDEGPGKEAGDRPNEVGERPSQGSKSGGSQTQNLYKIVAPATVIVRSARGYGTGFIYDPAGWILTNHHVVAHAKRKDFRWEVKIGLGKLSKQGVMEQEEKTYTAYVHKIDPLLDIAVVKLVKPPKRLVAIRLAQRDPSPGQHVTSLGHAGIGLLWAIKDGQIAAVGKLSKHLAQLQLYETYKEMKKDKAKLDYFTKRSAKALEELRKYLEKKIPALVIQSTCPISQGDSGGPLVNDSAELVGINAFVRSTYTSRKESNFHIHVSEVRKFIKDVPKEAPQLLPDPWNEGGSLAKLGDADMDSTVDVLAMYKVLRIRFFSRKQPMAYFVDLDQDSFKGLSTPPDVKEVVDKKSFDAELTFLEHGQYYHAWYDTDNNGKPDVLLVSGTRSRNTKGYRIDDKGRLKKDEALSSGPLIRPSLFSDGAMSERLTKVGPKIFSISLLPRTMRASHSYPHPVNSVGHDAKLKDYSGDGKPDTVAGEGLFSSGYVFDVDQDSIGTFKVGAPVSEVRKTRQLDAEFSWINAKNAYWAWYDRNNDGKFDLLFKANRYPGNIVADAWKVDAAGKYVQDKTQLGRLVVQPELLKTEEQAKALRKVASRVLLSNRVATGAGVKSFPDPHNYYGFGYRLKDVKRYKNAAAYVRMAGRCEAVLVDVDLDSARKARKAKKKLIELVKDKKFDAEFARVACSSDAWSFYDTRGKGSFDLVLYSSYKGKGKPRAAYVVDKQGKIEPRKKAITCEGLVLPALFKNRKLKRNFAKMAAELFSSAPDLSCKP